MHVHNHAMFQHDWQEQAREQEHDFLHFSLDDKSYAMALTDLLEIVDIDDFQEGSIISACRICI